MAALSFSKDLWDAIGVDSWKKWFTNTIWSIPFIPVPTSAGLGFVWAKTFGDVSSRALGNAANKVSLEWSTKQAFEDLALGDKDDKAATPPATGAGSTLTNDQITKIDSAIKWGTSRDDIIKANPNISTAAIDTQIAESIAKLAADGTQTLPSQASIKNTIENFKVASKTMTASQIKTIFDDPNSKLKHILAPTFEAWKTERKVKFNDKAWGTFTKTKDGEISLSEIKEDAAAADQGSYDTIDNVMRQNVEDFLKDLEEQIKKSTTTPAQKTKLEEIKKFYPTT